MERETERPPPPQLHGVVIITLPPPDNPFKGKTVTAFTLSDDPPPPPHAPLAAAAAVARSPLARAARRSLLSPRSAAAAVLGASLFLFSLWICLFSEAPLQLFDGPPLEEDGRRQEEERSFLLPLYPKSGGRALREVGDLKLGSISRKRKQSGNMETYASANSSTVLPIGGNLFPDGYACFWLINTF
ncbi:hypothetical protein B296_00006868 [Ensete ventricosum]|uniref:Uncharacterized protein n=1 Tax=Ensete ventricosum TaxID=4639 RepID=A0A427ANN3_ENSVE|nr:hypothetical protein B296_00006868 [Ensete ventricosum]